MPAEQNKTIFLKAMEKYNNGDAGAFLDILSDDLAYHISGNTELNGKED